MAAPEECPWQRHFDDNGVPFYYNEATEESEWDVPPAWKDHFEDLDNRQAAATATADDVDPADVAAGADENGHATDSSGVEQDRQQEEVDAERAAAAEQRQVDDAEGAQALLGLAQAAGEQHQETPQQQETRGTEDDGTEPMNVDQGSASPRDQDGGRHGAAGSREGSRAGSLAGGTPPHATTPPVAHDDEMSNGEQDGHHTHETNIRASDEDVYAPAEGAAGCPWIKSFDEESKTYFYYNEVTEESSWDKPEEYERFHAAQAAAAAAAATTTAAADSDEHSEEEYYQARSPEQESGAYGDDDDRYAAASPRYSDPEEEDEDDEDRGRRSSRSPSPRPSDDPAASSRQTRSSTRKDGKDNNDIRRSSGSISNNDKSSPSPEMALSFPAFGEDYSPNHDGDWQVNDEDDPKASGSPQDGAASFGVSMSPESEELRSAPRTPGFAVGELSPIVDHSGVNSAGGDGQQAGSGGAREAGERGAAAKKKSKVVGGGEGKVQYSEAELAQVVEGAEREVAECERRLEEKDAIMEVDFSARVTAYQNARERLQQLKDGIPNRQAFLKETRNASVKKLVAGYKGYAQQASLVNNWLQLATDGKEDTENLMLQQLKMLIKTNFDAKKVDTLLDSSMPGWLTAMQDDDGWRRTLIELAREHRASALLRFVLKQLSDMGYHREIASVISQTDLFSVFNGVLKDALARIPGGDEVEAIEALADLKRMCCSTSYMFMYSQQLLIDLERAAVEESRQAASALESADKVNGENGGSRKRGREESQSSAPPPKGSENKEAEVKGGGGEGDWGRTAAARKYKRLRQELAKHMYVVGGRADSNSSSPDGGRGPGSFSFGRSISSVGSGGVGGSSRSELNGGIGAEDDGTAGASSGAPTGGFLRGVEMGPSLRLLPSPTAAAAKSAKAASDAVVSLLGQAGGGGARRTGVVSDAVETLVQSFRLKSIVRAANQDEAAAAEQDVKQPRPPAFLLRHPTVMDIFLEALFHPSHRSPSEDLRAGCCALLAYASCVEVPVLDTGGSGDGGVAGAGGDDKQTETVDLAELAEASNALMQAAGECFVTSQLASLQGRLRPFAKHPLVSLGVLRWVHAQVSTEAFVSTPSFLSYAPVFLRLCGQAVDEHPPQRPETFEIMKLMLSASTAPDTPPAAKAKLKQHVLLRMADLVVKGYMLPVLDYLRHLATGSGLDPTLVGYFLVKIVGVAIPRTVGKGENTKGYSPAFLNAMAGLMGVPRVRQALIALKPVDRERFGGYARYCLKFQREDLTAEAREWIKQLQVGLERA